jgi:hypothetical protein
MAYCILWLRVVLWLLLVLRLVLLLLVILLLLGMQMVVIMLHISLAIEVCSDLFTWVIISQRALVTHFLTIIAVFRGCIAAIFFIIIAFFSFSIGLVLQKVRLMHVWLGDRLLKRISV